MKLDWKTVKRKGDTGIQFMALGVFIAALAQLGWMFTMPSQYQIMIQNQLNDFSPLTKSEMIKSQLEQDYVPQAIRDAAYEGFYQRGKQGVGVWTADSGPPDWGETRKVLVEAANTQFANNYLGAIRSGAGCSLNGVSGVDISYDRHVQRSGTPVAVMTTANEGPLYVSCDAGKLTINVVSGGFSSLTSTELVHVPSEVHVSRMRYRRMHQIARGIVDGGMLSQAMRMPAWRSATVATIDSCTGSTNNRCGWNPPTAQSFSDDHPLENEQEEMAGEQLRQELDRVSGQLNAQHPGFDISFDIEELEYAPQNIRKMGRHSGSWRVGCLEFRNSPDTYSTYSSVCGGNCPEDESCSLQYPGGRCSDSSVCPDVASKPSSPPPKPSGDGDWTQSVWTVDENCDYEYDDPYTYDAASNVAFRESVMKEPREYERGASHGGGSCTPSCDSTRHTCSEHTGSEARTRASWTFDVQSRTVVRVTINDTRHRIPTSDGFKHPVYRFTYDVTETRGKNEDSPTSNPGSPSACQGTLYANEDQQSGSVGDQQTVRESDGLRTFDPAFKARSIDVLQGCGMRVCWQDHGGDCQEYTDTNEQQFQNNLPDVSGYREVTRAEVTSLN